MATPTLNLGLIEYFAPLFIFILIFVFVYAALYHTRIFGENKILPSIIGVVIAFIFIMFQDLTRVIVVMAPWFTTLFIFLIFTIVAFKLFGATDDNIRNVITHHGTLQWFLIIICLLIAIGAMAAVFGQKTLDYGEGEGPVGEDVSVSDDGEIITVGNQAYSSSTGNSASNSYTRNLADTLYHPKTLGLVFILIIAALSAAMLTQKMIPTWPPVE